MATVNFVGASNTTGPFAIDGYYPLYATEAKSNTHSGGNGTSHMHVFFGQNFYMPNGLTLNSTYYHGTYDGSLTAEYNQSATTNSASSIKGYYYYKLDKDAPEYHNAWKTVDGSTKQRIITTYDFSQVNVDLSTNEFWVGCYPDATTTTVSGYDIIIKVNAKAVTNFTYGEANREGFIRFAPTQKFKAGDFIEISAYSDKGLVSLTGISKYEMPLSWGHNTKNTDITYISAPEYTEQFKDHIEGQTGFAGESLGSNNYQDGPRVAGVENNIVQTNQDILLGAFLLDDQPGNLVDALRFNANEYVKFKNRLRHEIEKYYSDKSVTGLSNEYVLEQVLRSVTSFKIGNDVFSKTYILPFGDNYVKEDFLVALGTTAFTLSNYLDLDLIENSLLVYLNNKLLTVEKDYTISSYNPIEISLVTTSTAGDTVCTKLYNAERDSAQCPPTPSTMGILPLHQPEIVVDTSFKTSISTLVGHDGSRQKAFGDFRDSILLEFETRIYNSAKAEFRTANSLPAYNSIDIRCGAFRTNGYTHNEFYDLLRHYFSAWSISNKLDPIVNEFYDSEDEWTWNYSSAELPGHWRGFYEYHYDTVRPHTHPWEMLGFTEKPLWFDEQYYVYETADVNKNTPAINYGTENPALWSDLEQGIIRQGPRKNTTSYKIDNPYRRIGLMKLLPIDADAQLISPYRIKTTDTTSTAVNWTNTTGTADSTFAFRTDSFRTLDGIAVSYDDIKLYVESNNLPTTTSKTVEQKTTFALPRLTQLTNSSVWTASSQTRAGAVGVLVNGDPLMSIDSGVWQEKDKTYATASWIYNKVQETGLGNSVITPAGIRTHYAIGPDVLGLTEWATDTASPIVGWAFDGLPIYGPYGYSDANDNTSSIIRIQSGWELDTRTRGTGNADETTGPGGKPTGQYLNDFNISASAGSTGYTDNYNMRLAVTADSSTPIYHYVATVGANGKPAFPYHVGGGIQSTDRWAGNYRSHAEQVGAINSINVTDKGGLYTSVPDITIVGDGSNATAIAVITNKKLTSVTLDNAGSGYTYATATITGGGGVRAKVDIIITGKDNSTFAGATNSTATAAISSTKAITLAKGTGTDGVWKFGDGAPVENAFKYSSTYPFALTEALVLAKPGRFATVFSDPTTLVTPLVNNAQFLSKNTNKRWKFLNTTDFKIHGDVNTNTGKMITNIGYTQFINSWLKFQGLDTTVNFATPLRSLNVKLAHRMSGFIDKDTLSARTDQYSNSGNATSLIIPKENITTTLHSSNYKSRNFYTGIVVEQTSTGYRVRGFDKNRGYFEVIDGIKTGKSVRIEVGGDPEAFTIWQAGVTYSTGNIVQHRNNFYQAPLSITSGATFDTSIWQRLAKLPQINSATAVQYLDSTEVVKRIPYETEYTTIQEVVDLMINLGRFQASQGFDFSEFDSDIAAVKDWAYSAKQFLFWTTGVWEIGNTIELSPLAGNIKFIAPRGFIAKINRTDREQFSIQDQIGEGIDPTHCTIVRENDYIEVSPPTGAQIYSLMLFTKEIEHALVFDNETNFSDVIFNDVFDQRHKRIKLKGQRTANWKGKFLSQGFIIDGEELLPNLDNMAESLGRYHEFGFIPVEKQVYQASRALFGYTERDYLTELDIQDDEQFDFYRGMIQGKGTKESLGRIARSSAVISGNVSIFDEWALRVGDFGDTENNQSIELKLVKTEITQDPQLITLDFPENVTNIVERIDVIDASYAYNIVPTIEISSPGIGGVHATATAILDPTTSKLQKINVTNAGSGYGAIPTAKVLASDIVISSSSLTINQTLATPGNYFDLTQTNPQIIIADALSSNAAVTISVTNTNGGAVTTANVLAAVNNNTAINANVKVSLVPSEVISGSSTVTNYTAMFSGKDFYLNNGANFGHSASNVHYQPTQRYAVSSAMAGSTTQTTIDDVEVLVDGTAMANSYFAYDSGSISSITTTETYPSLNTTATRADGVIVYPEQNNSFTITLSTAIDTNNLEIGTDGNYKFVDLYIGNVLISNSHNAIAFGDHDNNSGTAVQQYTTVNGTMFTIAGDGASITFPDVSRLPDSVKSTILNPPTSADADGKQQQIVKVIASGTVIKVIEDPTVALDASLKTDIPGAVLNIKVTAQDGIAVRLGTKRNYLVTEDDKNDDTILIDIDDATRFIKKPTGVKENNLWPTTKLVNASGITDPKYATVRNAGYVNKGNVTFQAFDIASIPDLYGDGLVFNPITNDLIHIANSEDNDWNVYKLTPTDATVHYLRRNANGRTSLLTNDSLFNYLDTNEIGATDTGKYLDYYLSLDNKNISDQVVVWTNEDIVQEKQSQITDFSAPQMIQSRIESIGPQVNKTITAVTPHLGKIINGITLTPKDGDANVIIATGEVATISNLDAFELVDRVGVVTQNASKLSFHSGTQITVDPIRVESITVTSGGSGYTSAPSVAITAGAGRNATALATIIGPIGTITIDIPGLNYAEPVIVISEPENTDPDVNSPTYGLANVATATATIDSDGIITAVAVTNAGAGYTSAPTVFVQGSNNGQASLTATLNAEVDSIVMYNKGTGYSATTVTVTVDGNATATATKTTPSATPVAKLYAAEGNDATKVAVRLLANMLDSLEFKIAPPRDATEQATYNAIRDIQDRKIKLASYNTTSGTFVLTLPIPTATITNVLANIDNTGYEAKVVTTFTPNSANFFTVTDTSYRQFEFPDITSGSTIGYSQNVSLRHLNKSKLTISNHGLRVGDVVRVFTNTFGGAYSVDSVIDSNNIVIKAPYIPGFSTGSLYGDGIQIKTVAPHGISPIYALANKSIAVHFADPKTYNKTYIIDSITPTTINIAGRWAPITGTATYYEHKIATLTGATAYNGTNSATATNVVDVTNDPKLNEIIVTYSANSNIVPPEFITSEGARVYINTAGLPAVTSASTYPPVEISVARQRGRDSNRYPLVTTLDFDKLSVNGSEFKIDNINSAKGVESAINRAIGLRKQHLRQKDNGVEIGFILMNDPSTPVLNGLPSSAISNYGPYVNDPALISTLTGGGLLSNKSMPYATVGEDIIDSEFNAGPQDSGPIYGLTYTDPNTLVYYIWNAVQNKYRAYSSAQAITTPATNSEASPMPANHKASYVQQYRNWEVSTGFTVSADPLDNIAYFANELITYESKNYKAIADITMSNNTVFDTTLWTELVGNTSSNTNDGYYADSTAESEAALLLDTIPGSGQTAFVDTPGVKRTSYNMLSTVTKTLANGDEVTIPEFRLGVSELNLFEIYQAVQNDGAGSANGEVYYILIDKTNPEVLQAPLDYNVTVNFWNSFGNYKRTSYYYINSIIPTVDASKRITNRLDPMRVESTVSTINLPPVEPAIFIGLQTVEEPFAVTGGNNSDAVANINSIDNLSIENNTVTVDSAGHNKFFMWTPGIKPGAWKPTEGESGPGRLPGVNGNEANFGYGRGYYALNQSHPADYPDVTSHVETDKTPYSGLMPRFIYSNSTKFTVNPKAINYDITTYTDTDGNIISHDDADDLGIDGVTTSPTYVDASNEDTGVTGIRPEELFVACFWTETHVYEDQITNWDYSTLDVNGAPTPIRSDYNGTVTRVKYIRLTELPANAFTTRLIPDTGWAGKGWNNTVADRLPAIYNEDDILNLFTPGSVAGGSTGDNDEGITTVLGLGDQVADGTVNVGATGQLASDRNNAHDIPVTPLGPMLNGEFLSGLPGPCATLPLLAQPGNNSEDCSSDAGQLEYLILDNLNAQRRGEDITLTEEQASDVGITQNGSVTYPDNETFDFSEGTSASTYADTYDNSNWQYVNVRVSGNNSLRVFFDFLESETLTHGSIVVVQNSEPYFSENGDGSLIQNNSTEKAVNGGWVKQTANDDRSALKETNWWHYARVLESTVVSGNLVGTKGDQVSQYGVDTIGMSGEIRNDIIDSSLLSQKQRNPASFAFDSTANQPNGKTVDEQRVSANHIHTSTGMLQFTGEEDTAAGQYSDNTANRAKWLQHDIGVSGIGFINTFVKCSLGEYITIFIRPDASITRQQTKDKLLWQTVVEFTGAVVDAGDIADPKEACVEGHSTAYTQGAIKRSWKGTNGWGYFGQHKSRGERFTRGNTNQRKAHIDNIYYPYMLLPNPYNSGAYTDMPDATWGNWGHCHAGYKVASHSDVNELAKTTITSINKTTLSQYSTTEIKGYFKAPHTGRYLLNGYCDDGIWAWISSEPTNLTHGGKPVRKGIDDLAGIDGDTRHEYFKEDGFRPNDKYNYHRDNPIIRTGWKTTNDHLQSNKPGDRYVDLEAGKYYFTRIIAGNNKGPGYYSLDWSCTTGSADFSFDVGHVSTEGGNGHQSNYQQGDGYGSSVKTGKLVFSGRGCAVDLPANAGSGTSGSPPGWVNKYSHFATNSQALAYENLSALRDCPTGNTTSWSSCQLSVWSEIGVCPPGVANCTPRLTGGGGDTPGVAPGYPDWSSLQGDWHTLPNGQRIWLPTIDIGDIFGDANFNAGINVGMRVGNSTTPGQRHLTGFNFLPYSTKLPTRAPLLEPNSYSFETGELDADTLVSGQAQRVSGGLILPFAKTLTTVSRTPYVLKSSEASNEPWGKNLQNSTELNKTTKYVKYSPTKIGSTVSLNGTTVNNITNTEAGNRWNGDLGNDTTEYTGPAYDEPGVDTDTGTDTTPTTDTGTGTNPLARQELAIVDVDNIIYNTTPIINITPRAIDQNGNYYNGGPTAQTYLYKPTPEVDFDTNDLIGIADGSELLINGRRIVKRGTTGIDIKTQINCANMGVSAELGADGKTLTLISCTSLPFTISNGCGGGTFKQVGDFHINRGFDQSTSTSETFIAPFISAGAPLTASGSGNAAIAIGGGGGGMVNGFETINDYRRLPDGSLEKFYRRPGSKNPDVYETPARIPLETVNKSTGGSNYRVGDRLRLIGGTPETNILGPLSDSICIESAGSGYTNPANLTIIFNESTSTPGVGGAATVTKLDENGGIAEAVVINQGAAYDVSNPPTLTVKDSSPIPTVISIDAAWTSQVTLAAGTIASINEVIQIVDANDRLTGEQEINSRYVRAVGEVQLGAEKTWTISSADVSYQSPTETSTKPRVEIALTTGNTGHIRPESYVQLAYYPGTTLNDYYITVDGAVTSSTTFVLDSINDVNGNQFVNAGQVMSWNDNGTMTILGYVTAVNVATKTVTLDTAVTLTDGMTAYFVNPQKKLYWVPKSIDGKASVYNNKFVIEDESFKSSGIVTNLFGAGATITVTARKPWYSALTVMTIGGMLVDSIDPNIPKNEAKLTISVGDPADRRGSGPLRVAKFIVTDVNRSGAITSIRVIDRGLYKEFPTDLTMGIPLEYDYALQGSVRVNTSLSGIEQTNQVLSDMTQTLGYADPIQRNDVLYGPGHPEYQYTPFKSTSDLAILNNNLLNDADKTALDSIVVKQNAGDTLSSAEQIKLDELVITLTETLGYDKGFKHPDFTSFPEFFWDGSSFQEYFGSPGAYDPTTYVCVDLRGASLAEYQANPGIWAREQFNLGKLIIKSKVIETDPKKYNYGDYNPEDQAGGTGARVFLTAQEIPNCSEKGNAKDQLGLPDVVADISAPRSIARNLNNALAGAGYLPSDARAVWTPFGDSGEFKLVSDIFPGFKIDEPVPGTLTKIGIPIGDYNTGMLCITAILENSDPDATEYTEAQALADIQKLYDTNEELGLLTSSELKERYPDKADGISANTSVLTLICAERIAPNFPPRHALDAYGTGKLGMFNSLVPNGADLYGMNDNNSIFGDGANSRMSELFSYDISNIFGKDVSLNGTAKQNAPITFFASKRFNKRNVIADLEQTVNNNTPTSTVMDEPNAWVDNYSNLRRAIIDNSAGVTNYTNIVYNMPNFVEGGWAYLENGIPKRWQTPLVDVEFINNALVYDPETGNKINDLDFWDPFKGILPGFISNEISFISEYDPVSYNNARTNFGKNNIGKVWWDTSTIRYNWYEQGTDKERNANWGSAFPGSQVTVCEWVESKAKPMNWTGDGQPRWADRFVTERRQDTKSGEYTMYYYYWVINRSLLDDRAKRNENRKLDTRTIAKYIADPVGYGLDMISFVSDTSMLLHNISDIREEESHLQINLSRNLNPEGISHTAWKLMREGDNDSTVPEHLTDKLIDSLCSENAEASPVPDPKLSEVEKYGIAFRPRQTMFKDVKGARRVMVSVLNRILANLRVNSFNPGWDNTLPTARAYLTTTDWFDVKRTDPVTNEAIRYTDTLKPIFNVTSVSALSGITTVTDGGIVQVQSSQNATSQLWMYNGPTKKFKLVSVANDTVQLPATVYTSETNPTLSSELRLVLTALKDNVFVNTSHWNELFFEMMKHAYMEQKQLSWAFKTSYLYINKSENDLTMLNGFKADNFQKVLDYMNEVKPFSAKIREYKDGKSAPIEVIGQNNISDYDRPPFVDLVSGTVRILDEGVARDVNIMSNSKQYINYVTTTADGYQPTVDPIRRANTTISFDRTNYQLTESAWDVANVSLQTSIGYNIANLSVQTKQEVSANVSVRAADKLFKFDSQVQAQFIAEVNTYYNDVTAARNTEIVGNGTVMAGLVASGQLKNTLALIKDKVGGNFRGETLDASKFSSIVDQADYMSAIQTDFGFDSDLFDENTDNDDTVFTDNRNLTNYGPVTTYGIGDAKWDNSKQIVSYEGVFDSNANPVTLRKNGESYDGFDGITFQRVAYGEERPEELALLDPLESVIFTVTTSDFSRGAAGNVSIFDELDTGNASLYHSTASLTEDNSSVVIVNGGIGYRAPTVVIEDAQGNAPTTTAVASATIGATGNVSAIAVTTGGAGYTEIHLSLTETLTETTDSNAYVGANQITFVGVTDVLVGQIVTVSSIDIGQVTSINATTVTLDSTLTSDITSGTVVNFRGQNFNYSLTNVVVSSTAGVDPDDADNFFAVDPVNGWDTATVLGQVGSFDTALTVVQERETTKVSPSAREIVYRMHHSLFGDVDFLRISGTATTKITKAMTIGSTSITVDNASFLPNPTSIIPGSVWVGSERIQYGRRSGKVLSALTRGAFGTTTSGHPINQPVYSAEDSEHFNNLNPSSNVWLDTGTRYGAPRSWDEAVDNTPGDLTDNDENSSWTVSGAWDKIEAANITTADVGVTITNVTSTTATLTAIGIGTANIALQEGIRIFANANVSLFEVVQVTGNASSVWSVTASYADTLDNTLFVENGTATLRSFVYAGQGADDDFDSATITGQSALSLADRGNADVSNTSSIMRFLHKL